jgi:4-hydroxy-tetrahydrodipicolinate synthase
MFTGVYTAIITPFKKDNSIDYNAMALLIEEQIKANINGIVILGTTGESPTITKKERADLIRFCLDVSKKIHVVVGVSGNCTKSTTEEAETAEDLGAKAIMISTPAYNKPTQKGLFEHFSTIAAKIKIPIMLYNVPGRTGVNLEVETVLKLAEIDNILAIKEASGNMAQIMDLILRKPKNFKVLAGDDALFYPLLNLGAVGVVSVMANIYPAKMEQIYKSFISGIYETALHKHNELLPLMNALFMETNPIPVKTLLAMQGKIEEQFRLPLCSMEDKNKQKLKQIFKL